MNRARSLWFSRNDLASGDEEFYEGGEGEVDGGYEEEDGEDDDEIVIEKREPKPILHSDDEEDHTQKDPHSVSNRNYG